MGSYVGCVHAAGLNAVDGAVAGGRGEFLLDPDPEEAGEQRQREEPAALCTTRKRVDDGDDEMMGGPSRRRRKDGSGWVEPP